jgi:hypothetical protein
VDAFWTKAQTTFRTKVRDDFNREGKALGLDRKARSVALGLLGEVWTRDNLPGKGCPSEYERSRT